jgi:hypothetical protein
VNWQFVSCSRVVNRDSHHSLDRAHAPADASAYISPRSAKNRVTVIDVNAVAHFAGLLPAEVVRRLAALRVVRFDAAHALTVQARGLDVDASRERVLARWGDDLCGFLNALTRGELNVLVEELSIQTSSDARAPQLRELVWQCGAELESGGAPLDRTLQPRPVLLGGHLVIQAAPRGAYPASEQFPRAVPQERYAQPPSEEPETLDELLAAAECAIGVRLGRRGADKGAWGLRAAALLGVTERGGDEPDWRGDVEIKTVPVAREASGLWRVVEDPAISMVGPAGRSESAPLHFREGNAVAKLQRTLWLARTDLPDGDATIVSWYLLEWDPIVARLARRYLHVRPKGPAGTDQRGLYLSKRFFADAGLLATLNGVP